MAGRLRERVLGSTDSVVSQLGTQAEFQCTRCERFHPIRGVRVDPTKPVPYRARPIDNTSWSRWLVDDQREASGRPDVVSFVSNVLTEPVKISGEPMVNLHRLDKRH